MRVLLADDQRLFRESVAALVKRSCIDIELIIVANFDESLDAIKRHSFFDAVVLDYIMPGMVGREGISVIRRFAPTSNIAVISGMSCCEGLLEIVLLGGVSFIPKTLSADQFIEVIKFISKGGLYVPPDLVRGRSTGPVDRPYQHQDLDRLTPREREVLNQLREGLSNKEIARNLGIEDVTVRLHLRGVFHKLGAKNRLQALTRAIEFGLPPPSSPVSN
jgi:DNA-binding NarL/FixJ family response regulator